MGILKMYEEIFKISKNNSRAKNLLDMAEERKNDIKKNFKPYKIIEEYYEIIKELVTAIMYIEGYKTLSHKSLIIYLKKNYNKSFSSGEFILIDRLRKLRNEILYYGKKISKDFLINNEEDIKKIINNLIKITNEKLK